MDKKESNYVLSELGKLLTDVMDLDPALRRGLFFFFRDIYILLYEGS